MAFYWLASACATSVSGHRELHCGLPTKEQGMASGGLCVSGRGLGVSEGGMGSEGLGFNSRSTLGGDTSGVWLRVVHGTSRPG